LRHSEYEFNCDHCSAHIYITVVDEQDEPEYCPMCGEVGNPIFIDAELDSDDV